MAHVSKKMYLTSHIHPGVLLEGAAALPSRGRDLRSKSSIPIEDFNPGLESSAIHWCQEPKEEPQSQRIARTAPKNCLNNSRGLPVITHSNKSFGRQIAPESSPESSAKSLSQKFFGAPFSQCSFVLPLPQCFSPRGRKLRPWSEKNSDQNPDHPRLCIYQGKEKLRPWSEFLGRENSDHGLSFSCFGGRGRRGGSHFLFLIMGSLAKGFFAESFAEILRNIINICCGN